MLLCGVQDMSAGQLLQHNAADLQHGTLRARSAMMGSVRYNNVIMMDLTYTLHVMTHACTAGI